MKATGIVRRIDDLGRIVIPKEIRRTMHIREGDPLEIYTGQGNEVIFKKYSPVGELSSFADIYASTLSFYINCPVLICDRDYIICASGEKTKSLKGARISEEIEKYLSENIFYERSDDDAAVYALEGSFEKKAAAVCPILSMGGICGGVIILEGSEKKLVSERDAALIRLTASLLSAQTEV